MTDEERRLAELLRQAVPQPPRSISVADIADRVAHRPKATPARFTPWLPALAAACVLLVVAATSVWLLGGHWAPSAPTAQSSSAGASLSDTSNSASTSPVPSATSAKPTTPTPYRSGSIGAFGARLLNSATIGPTIVSGAGAVYGLEQGDSIDRFDPSSGAITAQAPLDENANWPPLVTTRALWQTVVTPGTVTIQLLDPDTLQKTGSTRIAAATPSPTESRWTPVLVANADFSEIFLGNAGQIYSLDPVTGAVEHQVNIPGQVGGLAVSPGGSRLYAAVNVQGAARLLVLDIGHGLSTLSTTPLAYGPVARLLATSGGLWITYITGRDNNILFAPLTDLAHTQEAVPGGGGLPASATLAGGRVFLSGIYTIACADAATAAVRAQAQQMGEQGLTHYFGSVQLVAGHYLASFQTNYSDDHGLAILTPPAACR